MAAVSILTVRETLAAADTRRYAIRLTTQEAHFRSLVAASTDVTVAIDDDLIVRWQSPASARQFGLSIRTSSGCRSPLSSTPWTQAW